MLNMIDQLDADFMDLQELTLRLTLNDLQTRKNIVLITRQFKSHLSTFKDSLSEKGAMQHG